MSVVSRAPEAVLPRPKVLHRSIQVTGRETDGAVEWRRRHARALLLGDLLVLALALGTAQVIRFGSTAAPQVDGLGATYPALGLVLAVVWWASLQVHQSRSPLDRRTWSGGVPARHCCDVPGVRDHGDDLAGAADRGVADLSRDGVPAGPLGLLIERKLARVGLHRARTRGAATTKVLVVGGARSAAQLTRWFAKHPTAGYAVGGVWIPDAHAAARDAWTAPRAHPGDVGRASTSPRLSRVPGPAPWW